MKFWLTSFCLLYILSYVEVGPSNQTFHIMALGHSGLLISWDPATIEDCYETSIDIEYRVLNESNSNNSGFESCGYGQYKIHSVSKEDSLYEINITIYKSKIGMSGQTTILYKTGLKKHSVPEKPYFKWFVSHAIYGPIIRINWIPCGKNGDCHGNEAGTHFAIKYKILDLRETVTIVEPYKAYHDIVIIFPGRIYEIVVISINGDFGAESDPQEVVYRPISGPVQSVRVLVLKNTSLYISWENPRISMPGTEIKSIFISRSSSNGVNALYLNVSSPHYARMTQNSNRPQRRLNNLIPNIIYTFLISPCRMSLGCGLNYKFDYSIGTIQSNLTLAKPDFQPVYLGTPVNLCYYDIFWLPCVEVFDCKNMNPGSGFELTIENRTMTRTFIDKINDYAQIQIPKNETYKITGRSVDEFGQSSESVTKTIICNED